MGYGTTLTPVLMTPSFGLAQKVIVQSILVSELLTGTLAVVSRLSISSPRFLLSKNNNDDDDNNNRCSTLCSRTFRSEST